MPARDPSRWMLFCALMLLAFMLGRRAPVDRDPVAQTERAAARSAQLTNPFLEAEGIRDGDPELLEARDRIAAFIGERRRQSPSLRVSVYARDLANGHWIGIDEQARYTPSSLTKVVVLIHTLAQAEEEPGLLDREIVFPGADRMIGDDTMLEAPDSVRLHAGVGYPIRDLLRRMIAHSDNYAYQLLLEAVGSEGIPQMMYDLNADQTLEKDRFYFDARTVARLLRALYNSAYLSRRHSELALELLTETRFREGLRRSLPPEAVVASKFGFHSPDPGERGHIELHECGVVYRPPSPYVVCVMTATDQGTPEELGQVLGEVSRILWAR